VQLVPQSLEKKPNVPVSQCTHFGQSGIVPGHLPQHLRIDYMAAMAALTGRNGKVRAVPDQGRAD